MEDSHSFIHETLCPLKMNLFIEIKELMSDCYFRGKLNLFEQEALLSVQTFLEFQKDEKDADLINNKFPSQFFPPNFDKISEKHGERFF